MADNILGAYNIADLREMARGRLPKGMFEFVDRELSDRVQGQAHGADVQEIRREE